MTTHPHAVKLEEIEASILPRPFCGKQPATQESGESGRGLMIDCITEGCVNPHTSYHNHEYAIRVWNTRALQSKPIAQEEMTEAEADAGATELVAHGEFSHRGSAENIRLARIAFVESVRAANGSKP